MSKANPLQWRTSSVILSYGVAVLSVTAALIVAWWLNIYFETAPVALFLCAAMFSAWFGGVRPGLLAAGLCALAFNYYFLLPIHSFALEPKEIPRFIIFVLSAIFVGSLSAAQRRAAESLKDARNELQGTVQDLTRTNAELQSSKAFLADAQRISHTGSWSWCLPTGQLVCSEEWYRIFGFRPLQVEPTLNLFLERLHSEDRPVVRQILDNAIRARSDFKFEFRIALPDGSIKYLQGIGRPVVKLSGDIDEYFGTTMDITERKEAEAALRKSEEQWRAVFEHNPTMYFMLDADGIIMSVNPFGAEQLGYTVDELVGHSVLNVFHEADRDAVQRNVAICLEQLGQTKSWEVRKIRKDGTMLWVRENVKGMSRANNRPIALVACEDITKRREAQDELRRSEALLAEGQRISHTGSWSWCLPTGQLVCSEEWYRIFGFRPLQVEPTLTLVLERLHSEDRPVVRQILDNAIRDRSGFDYEFRIALPDGSIKYLQVAGRPVVKLSGDVDEYIGITMDITERRQAEEALRERESRIRRLVESNIIGIFFGDPYGNIIDANDAMLKMIGYSRQDLLSGNVRWASITLLPEYHAADARAIEELERTGTCIPYEKEFIRKDGSRVPVLIGGALLDGSQKNGVGFVLDLTDRKRAEEALRKAHDELEWRVLERTSELQQSNRQLASEVVERQRAEAVLAQRSQELARSNTELEQMAYVASHDLQEPLRMVSSYMQLLEQQYTDRLDADAHEFIGFAVDGARRMQALIEDLLTYSRVGSRAKPLQPTDCAAVVQTALRSLRMAIEESGAQVQCGPLPVVMGDAAQLAQVFQNLIANAIKFRGQQAPRIAVGAKPEDGFWRFAVQDNGIGIAPEYFERIFVMFQRLHSRSTHPGTGIGLAICKKIVERHGGRIWVESAPEQGAVFQFTLPQPEQGAVFQFSLAQQTGAGREQTGAGHA